MIFACQLLRRGLCPAYVAGGPSHPVGAVVGVPPGVLLAFGDDPRALWELIQPLRGWTAIAAGPGVAHDLGHAIQRATSWTIRYQEVLLFILPSPVIRLAHAAVRLMTPEDVELVAAGPGGSVGAAYWSVQALLAEGCVAGAVVDGRLVARAHTSCQSPRYADVAVATAEESRGKGLATAAASLVCEQVQRSGRIPVWSTGGDNLASQRIAAKLGFVLQSRLTHLAPSRAAEQG
jgi:hypothetical protein